MTPSLILQSGFIGIGTGLIITTVVLLWKKEPVSGKSTVVAGAPKYVAKGLL